MVCSVRGCSPHKEKEGKDNEMVSNTLRVFFYGSAGMGNVQRRRQGACWLAFLLEVTVHILPLRPEV